MTARLSHLAVERYDYFDGYAVAHGLQPLADMPLERMCRFIYYLVMQNMDAKQSDRFLGELWMPVSLAEPIDARSPWSAEAEMQAFAGLKAMVGGSV